MIAKLKAQQNSQQSKQNVEAVKPVKTEIPLPDEDDDMMDEEEIETKAENPKKDQVNQEKENVNQILMEIEMLQNDGRYRAELLHQMQEINKALIVIAGVLVDLSGNGKA